MIEVFWFYVVSQWLAIFYFIAADRNVEGNTITYTGTGMMRVYKNTFQTGKPFSLLPITLMPFRNTFYAISFIDVMVNKFFKFK